MLIQVPEQSEYCSFKKKKQKKQQLSVSLAKKPKEVKAAQRLRHDVFSQEYGANFHAATPGIDADKFDQWCDHLLVHDQSTKRVVGTYRILRPEQAIQAGGFYSESEFDLSGLSSIRHEIVEFGRACIDPEYRSGPTLMLLWSGLSALIRQNNYQYVLGCASVSLRDDGVTAAEVWRSVRGLVNQVEGFRVTPLHPYPVDHVNPQLPANIPALIAGYLKLGVKVCGEPAWDPDFNTVDFPMLLTVSEMNARYKQRLGFEDQPLKEQALSQAESVENIPF
ncbi:GNAT family N-acetyltransferase [Zwartia sp.]|uniref:GNAT family N-acetyltransferase n=1 Tax=Zwartia sp. TaxID=2978004 RepID=UPI003BAF35EA